jgi:hypothetical protein
MLTLHKLPEGFIVTSKQTAVEWLAETLRFANKELYAEMYEDIEQAKEMEKQQIINAYQAGDGDAYNLEETKTWAEQYYNETYGGNK